MKRVFDFIKGEVFVELSGTSPERFFNICRSRKIPLYNVSTQLTEKGTCYVAKMKLKDYLRIRPTAKKTHCIPYIRKRLGLPFWLKKYRSRIMFFAGGFYCLWFVWLLSCFVWDISVTGGFVHTEEELLSYLRENGVVCGMRCETVNCTDIERQLRIDYPDIGWVSAELRGTKLFLRVAETDMPIVQEETKTPVHLVATADGIVEKLVCRKGTPLVKEGDVVKKGDILVSGIISVIGDNDIEVDRYPVAAEADITLKTIKKYMHTFERKMEEHNFTGKSENGYRFFYGNKKIFSHMPSHSYTNYAIITEDAVLSLHKHFPLPFRVQKTTVSEYVPVIRDYTKEEAEQVAEQALERYVAYLTGHGTKVLSVETKMTMNEKNVVTTGKLVLLSEAWEQVAVQENEWRLQNSDEYSGNNDESSSGA
ncbi:MAG: sporulation protein YqfD [Lachnospiraceae bacterium]|nr:sporulation protein YqfD [Lachnospiraceae bacterium]